MQLDQAACVGGYVTLGDTTYQCTPLTLEDFGLAQAYRKSKTPDPMEGIAEICNSLHVDVAKVLAVEAYRSREKWGALDTDEGKRWVASADGLSFFLYRQTRKHHPDVTLEELQMKCAELESSMIMKVFSKLEEISGGLPRNPTLRARRPSPKKKQKRR